MRQRDLSQTTEETELLISEEGEELPEGGYGWVVVFASFLVHVVTIGIPTSFGVFQQEYASNLDTYEGDHSELAVAFIGATMSTGLVLLGVVAGRLGDIFGAQLMCVFGALLGAGSFIAASFATKYYQLLITQGILFGLACGFAWIPAVTAPCDYFDKRKGLAMGLGVSGSGVGGLFLAPTISYMLATLGLAWTNRLLGIGAGAVLLVCAVLLKPRKKKTKEQIPFDYLGLLRNHQFIRLEIVVVLLSIGYYIPFFYLPKYAVAQGMGDYEGALALGLMQGASGIGRIIWGMAADRLGHINTLFACLFFASVSIFVIWPFSTAFGILIFFSLSYGIFCGGFVSLLPTVTVVLFGSANISTTTGMVYTGFTIGSLLGSPGAGLLLDYYTTTDEYGIPTINFLPSTLLSGGFMLAASVVLLLVKLNHNSTVFSFV